MAAAAAAAFSELELSTPETPDCARSAREWRAARAQPYPRTSDGSSISQRFRRIDASARVLVECFDRYRGLPEDVVIRELGSPGTRLAVSRTWLYDMGPPTEGSSETETLVLSFDAAGRLRRIERPLHYSSSA